MDAETCDEAVAFIRKYKRENIIKINKVFHWRSLIERERRELRRSAEVLREKGKKERKEQKRKEKNQNLCPLPGFEPVTKPLM